MRKVHLHGRLRTLFGPMFELEIESPAEAIRALNANFPAFSKVIRDGAWRLVRGSLKKGKDIDLDDIEFRLGRDDLHIVPVLAGSKNAGGALKVILGVALIGAAVFFAPAAGMSAPLLGGNLLGLTFSNVALLGLGIAAAGASSLLSHSTDGSDKGSFAFSGPLNMNTQGNCIPTIYGFSVAVGSTLISAGFDVEQL